MPPRKRPRSPALIAQEIEALLASYATEQKVTLHVGAGVTSVRVRAVVRASEPPWNAEPREFRGALYDAAEELIAAVEEAGYQHATPPKIEINGEGVPGPHSPSITACAVELDLTP